MEPTLTPLAAVVLLFLAVGVGFIFVHLMAGKFIRPNKPDAEKKTIYECGEPTIGSAWIQFDLRFYVVALLFVIFDVEVAFFFPWAEVFGKAQAVATAELPKTEEEWKADYMRKARNTEDKWKEDMRKEYRANADLSKEENDRREKEFVDEMWKAEVDRRTADGMKEEDEKWQAFGMKVNALVPDRPDKAATRAKNLKRGTAGERDSNQEVATQLMYVSLAEIAVFFGVLLVGFAYLWRRGDLEWVRSTLAERPAAAPQPPPPPTNGAPLVGAPSGGALVEAGS
jgi:NADH-quinone oxidoreductase subunit A